jgi:hypothetical protein
LIQSAMASRRRSAATDAVRFDLLFFGVVLVVSFLAVYFQKPVYIYSRFFLYLPIVLSWVAARGWSTLSLRQTRPVSSPSRVELLQSV